MAADDLAVANEIAERLWSNIETVVHGKQEQIKLVVAALMCSGHALLEDVPGTGKDGARARDRRIDQRRPGTFRARRISSRPTSPASRTSASATSSSGRGPFANVVLVDEINRAMPSAVGLLEGDVRARVTVDGETRPLGDPFLVATQNPIEYEGRLPLPEAQLDRFFAVKTALGYPDAEDEAQIVDEQLGGHPLGRLTPVVGLEEIATLRAAVGHVFLHEAVARWIVDLVRATREIEVVAIGSSVRGTLALNRAARAWAVLHSRRYVTPDDVERLFVPVLMHRLLFRPSFLAEIRDHGLEAASLDVRRRCIEVAPKPGFDIDLDVPAAVSA